MSINFNILAPIPGNGTKNLARVQLGIKMQQLNSNKLDKYAKLKYLIT